MWTEGSWSSSTSDIDNERALMIMEGDGSSRWLRLAADEQLIKHTMIVVVVVASRNVCKSHSAMECVRSLHWSCAAL